MDDLKFCMIKNWNIFICIIIIDRFLGRQYYRVYSKNNWESESIVVEKNYIC